MAAIWYTKILVPNRCHPGAKPVPSARIVQCYSLISDVQKALVPKAFCNIWWLWLIVGDNASISYDTPQPLFSFAVVCTAFPQPVLRLLPNAPRILEPFERLSAAPSRSRQVVHKRNMPLPARSPKNSSPAGLLTSAGG